MDFLHFRDFASPTMAHPRCRELCKRAGSLRLAELFRPILFLLLPGSYSFLKVDGSGVRVSAGSTLRWNGAKRLEKVGSSFVGGIGQAVLKFQT